MIFTGVTGSDGVVMRNVFAAFVLSCLFNFSSNAPSGEVYYQVKHLRRAECEMIYTIIGALNKDDAEGYKVKLKAASS